MTIEFVKFSAQGTYFLWKKEDVLSHDWLLAGMIREPTMAIMSGDQFYVDVDSTALRSIYNILQGIVQKSDLRSLSSMEQVLIMNTAEYLLCSDIVSMSQEIIHSTKNEIDFVKVENLKLENKVKEMTLSQEVVDTKNKELHKELGLIKEENQKLEYKIKDDYEPKVAVFNLISSFPIKGFKCPRPDCRKKIIVISPLPFCKHTNFDFSALCCGHGQIFNQVPIENFDDLVKFVISLNRQMEISRSKIHY